MSNDLEYGITAEIEVPFGDSLEDIIEIIKTIVGQESVLSFNGRHGAVVPASGDYSAAHIIGNDGQSVQARFDKLFRVLATPEFRARESGAVIACPGIENYHLIAIAYKGDGSAQSGYSDGVGVCLAYRDSLSAESARHNMTTMTMGDSGASLMIANRGFNFGDYGLRLEIAQVGKHNASSTGTYNKACVPIKVYGIA